MTGHETLSDLQRLFWRAVRHDPAPREVDDAFVSRGALSARARMAIYRDMYWFRQVDALFSEFPRVSRALGVERFAHLVSTYITAHPSQHPALECLGRELAPFMREHPDEHVRSLAHLAALEWAHTTTFLQPEPERLASLAEIAPAAFASSRLRFVPAIVTITVGRHALEAWDAHVASGAHAHAHADAVTACQDGDASTRAAPDSTLVEVVVFRKGNFVFHAPLASDESRALAAARAGEPLADVCEAFSTDTDPTARAFAVIATWFSRQLVASIERPSHEPPSRP